MQMQLAKRPASAPLYQRIAQQLIADIRRGRYRVGAVMPTEHELCSRFHASRYTVREAMRELTEKGLVSRRPRAGSVVTAREQPAVYTQRVDSIVELLNYPESTFRETRETGTVTADRTLAALLKCEPGKQWFRIRTLRYQPGLDVPICWTDLYLLPQYASIVKRRDHGRVPVFKQLEEAHGVQVEAAHLDIFASSVPAKLARLLKVKADSPALTIVRRYLSTAGENFENTVSIHPGSRFTYSIDLHRELRALR
jgi:DNA-binding GntR family transcriptional regulator